jgi:hypothetical protein
MKLHTYRILTILAALAVAVVIAAGLGSGLRVGFNLAAVHAQSAGQKVALDPDDIGGVVTGPKGPEAGVWVIAETADLGTQFTRIVVTNDQGQYLIPDLPKASYQVFVRGYGLVDSPRMKASPGQMLDLKAVVAPDAKSAAQIYPANYWLSLMEAPSGKLSELEVASTLKNCLQCHQIGNKATREVHPAIGAFKTHLEAWDKRVAVGPSGANMSATFKRLGPQRAAFSNWTERVAAGAVPEAIPPRPRGVERNLVVSMWDWGTPMTFSHTHAATDRRNPSVNANGRIYGPDRTNDLIVWVDPVRHTTGQVKIPTRDVDLPRPKGMPSPYWGEESIAGGPVSPRSAVMDQQGRVYVAATIRAAENQPAWCREGSTNKYAQYYPMRRSTKQVAFLDPKTNQMTLIDTCFQADHNEFGESADNPLYFGQTDAVGWVSMTTYDKTKDEQAAQGWCPGVIDTNGDGKITKPWTEPGSPVDPARDTRIEFGCYEIGGSPGGEAVWCSGIGFEQNKLVRIERGSNPPETCKAEIYTPPAGHTPPVTGGAGGVKIDSEGVAWQNWRATDHITSFDRRKCKTLNGPKATGGHCPEGWTVYRKTDLPTLKGMPYHSDLNYLIMVDKHDTAGLGKNVPITYPNNSDALLALLPQSKEWVTLRVPYPLGFYTRQAHGRIDDPNAGWKGRGLWSTNMSYAIWHQEGSNSTMGGKGQKAKVVKFQVRPNPLAK